MAFSLCQNYGSSIKMHFQSFIVGLFLLSHPRQISYLSTGVFFFFRSNFGNSLAQLSVLYSALGTYS